MDFYSAQDEARRRTRLLILLFILAVAALIVVTNLFIMIFAQFSADAYVHGQPPPGFWEQFDWGRFLGVGAGVTGVIASGSAIRTLSLRDGGRTVAEMLDGRLVSGNPRDALERRLLNVVEEMAIAAGAPVPQVYVLDREYGINAFAAGHTPGDAVIAVTRGTLEKLNRAELQGVVAHEFSHIVNGDMRLNLRLIGLLFGILMVALVGRMLFRWGSWASSSSSSREGAGAGVPIVLMGLGLLILGYVGVFFGNIIKAAVSRQREYLADASAVQFTREPQGIAGALKKIGGDSEGSLVRHPDAEELSHAYFAEGIHYFFQRLFATHPPLEDRIRRVDPRWDGQFVIPHRLTPDDVAAEEKTRRELPPLEMTTGAVVLGSMLATIDQAGQPDEKNLAEAERLLEAIPPALHQLAEEPHGARALIYALVLDRDPGEREKQLAFLRRHADQGVAPLTERYQDQVANLAPRLRLTLVDLSLPALRQLSSGQYRLFRDNLQALVEMDGRITPFEWALQKIVLHYLETEYEHHIPPLGRYGRLDRLSDEIAVVLGYLALHNHDDQMERLHAFNAGARELELEGLAFPPESRLQVQSLDHALDRLAGLRPLLKPRLLKACAACVASDGQITALEMELLRAFSAVLDCPLPPLPLETA